MRIDDPLGRCGVDVQPTDHWPGSIHISVWRLGAQASILLKPDQARELMSEITQALTQLEAPHES